MLTPTQGKMVNDMRMAGPTRWLMLTSIDSKPFVRAVMTAYVAEEKVCSAKAALVVSPASMMHLWQQAGWKGDHLSSVQFMNGVTSSDHTIGVAAFDEQVEYPAKFIERLDVFLTDHAERCVFHAPTEPQAELTRVLARHRFVVLNVN